MPAGRPPYYTNAEDMQKIIDEYFEWCDNRAKKTVDSSGQEFMVSDPAPYTMSGLARRLGMSRRTLVDYAEKDEFLPTIKAARARVEEDVESRMNDKQTFTPGLIFNAKNNFDWKDKSETDLTSKGEKIETNTIVLSKFTNDTTSK